MKVGTLSERTEMGEKFIIWILKWKKKNTTTNKQTNETNKQQTNMFLDEYPGSNYLSDPDLLLFYIR